MASGNLGLITFPRMPGRVTLEQIEAERPGLIEALRTHPGHRLRARALGGDGPVVLGPRGRHLTTGAVEGEDPLAPFGPNAADHVRRTDAFPHCPDLVVNSTYWAELDEVAAFEELVGSHGGLGGAQSHPFVLAPARPAVAGGAGGRAPRNVHRVLRGWLAALGQDAYRRDRAAGGERLDARRRGPARPREPRSARAARELPVLAAAVRGRNVPQWIGIAIARPDQRDRPRRPLGVQVTGAERRAPAPDREQRDVDRPRSSSMLVVEVGVAGEPDAVDQEAERVELLRRRAGRRRPSCHAGTTRTLHAADVDRRRRRAPRAPRRSPGRPRSGAAPTRHDGDAGASRRVAATAGRGGRGARARSARRRAGRGPRAPAT